MEPEPGTPAGVCMSRKRRVSVSAEPYLPLMRLPDGGVLVPVRLGGWHGMRRRRTMPGGTSWHYLAVKDHWFVYVHRKWLGLQLHAITAPKWNGRVLQRFSKLEKTVGMKKREALGLVGVIMPGANPVSVTLSKLPSIREFLSCTVWEDGTGRQPGTVKISTNGTVWEVLLQCPSTASRLVIRSAKLDEALMAAEQYCSAPDAPWEVDRYLAEKLAEKKPRKK